MAVSKQFNNRRQPVLINNIDPEILTEAQLSADGFVKNTDYATASKGGVFKTSSNYRTYVNPSNGLLTCSEITAAQYPNVSGDAFISKKSLENVKLQLSEDFFIAVALGSGPDPAAGTKYTGFYAEKTADGWDFGFETVTPPETP